MSPADARLQLLLAELQREWQEVRRHASRAQSADPNASEHAAAFVALELDHAYQAFESLLLRIEKGLGVPTRSGSSWHRELLEQSALAVPGLRPAIVPPTALADWATVMSFRHFLRHAYSVDLDAARLRLTLSALARSIEATGPNVHALLAALTGPES